MKTPMTHPSKRLATSLRRTLPAHLALMTLITSLGTTALLADEPGTPPGKDFQIGQTSFPRGDLIEITSVERSPDRVVVKGHYNLVSADTAQLALYTTTSTALSALTDPAQLKLIFKGKGDFELIHPHLVAGMNHVTMYSLPGGRPFAGVYFGNQEEAAAESKMELGYGRGESTAEPAGMSGPNRTLLEYLGNPVTAPAPVDERYTAAGLSSAIQHAASNAGITVKQVAVDESEFPCLVAVVCGGSDFSPLKAELRKMGGYEYNGSIGNDVNPDGSDTCNAFSLVPYRAYPAGAAQRIYHRLGLRQQIFFDKINGR